MRSHAQIVRDAGTEDEVAEWRAVSPYTIRSWIARDKIPDEHWIAFAENDKATLEELASYAAQKKQDIA